MRLASMLDVEPRIVTDDGNDVRSFALFGAPRMMDPGPQVHYTESITSGMTARTHFHEVDQFQLFMDGDGAFGNKPIVPIVVQYADAYTPYGPIVAGPVGFRFLTLRLSPSQGTFYMPERRAERLRRGGRTLHVQFDPGEPDTDGTWVPRLGPFDDGLGAYSSVLAPNTGIEALSRELGVGQYYVVAGGGLHEGGREHPLASTLFVEPTATRPMLRSSPRGLTLVALTFPVPIVREEIRGESK
jgi:hypothetical protein